MAVQPLPPHSAPAGWFETRFRQSDVRMETKLIVIPNAKTATTHTLKTILVLM
jgi:hypothetical protein